MTTPEKKSLILPIALITVGSGWLLSTLGYVPSVDWLWTLGLAVVGLLTFLVGGVDKFTVVVGTFFIIASVASVARQTGRLPLNLEVPILVIVSGILLLVARSSRIPTPKWLEESARDSDG